MKKEWIVLVLMLCVTAIAVSQAAAHAEAALPEVPEYSGQTEAAMLSAPEDALKYAQKLCEADYFQLGDLTDAYWDIAELEDGAYLAEAEQDGLYPIRGEGAVRGGRPGRDGGGVPPARRARPPLPPPRPRCP